MGFLQTTIPFPSVDIGIGIAEGPGDVAITLQILLPDLSLGPAIPSSLLLTRTIVLL